MSKMPEFEKIKALFTTWVETGVPNGIEYPKTQSAAVGWKCEQFGISGVGTKTYFNTRSPEYGKIVQEIKALIAQLKPQAEVRKLSRKQANVPAPVPAPENKRVYVPQATRTYRAQSQAKEFEAELIATVTQLQQTREALVSLELSLKIERQATERLRAEKAKLEQDNARLTRLLAAKTGLLHVVE